MVVAAGLVLLIAALGTALTLWVDVPLRLEERIPLGVVVGLVAVAAGSLVGFQAFGMGWAALAVGLGPAGAAGVLAVLMRGEVLLDEVASAGRRLQLPCRAGASLRPLVLLTVACTAVTTRILSLAYQHDADGGIAAGNLAVVDSQLRVRGIAGLRIVDAGVMPTITSGNTNSPVLMMAEKAARWIMADAA